MIRVLFNFTKFFLLLIFFFGNIYQLNANYHLVDDKILNNVYFEHNNKQNENQLLDDEVLDRVYFDHKSQQIEDSYDNKFQVDRFKYDEEEIIPFHHKNEAQV